MSWSTPSSPFAIRSVLLSLRRRWCIDTVRTPAPPVHCALTIYPLESIKAIAVLSLSAREFGLQSWVITGDELGLGLWISISPCLFRPTRALAFAFKHGPSLRVERNLARFLKCVFSLASKITFPLKLIPFFFKSNLGLRQAQAPPRPQVRPLPHHPDQMTLQSSLVILGLFSDLGTTDGTQGDYLSGDMRVVGLTAPSSTFFRPHRHPSDRTDRTDHTRDDSDDGCDDARYTADAANAREPTDAADDAWGEAGVGKGRQAVGKGREEMSSRAGKVAEGVDDDAGSIAKVVEGVVEGGRGD
ncbi:hypothetical protein FB107DRAFT_250096 [Schizophyllum commune]